LPEELRGYAGGRRRRFLSAKPEYSHSKGTITEAQAGGDKATMAIVARDWMGVNTVCADLT
jgi:hypothetical protein